MRHLSCILPFAALPLIMLSLGSAAKANGVDPSIVFGGGGSCQSFVESTATQSFIVDTATNAACSNTNGYIDFHNEIADGTFDITTLFVTIDETVTPFDGTVSCLINSNQSFFNMGTPTAGNACEFTEVAQILLSIPPGATYGLQFGALATALCPAPGCSPFTLNGMNLDTLKVTLSTAPLPEPATLLLLGPGLCGIAALRRKRQKDSKAIPNAAC